MDTSRGSLSRSGLRPASGGRTDHLSVQLGATARASLLEGTEWTKTQRGFEPGGYGAPLSHNSTRTLYPAQLHGCKYRTKLAGRAMALSQATTKAHYKERAPLRRAGPRLRRAGACRHHSAGRVTIMNECSLAFQILVDGGDGVHPPSHTASPMLPHLRANGSPDVTTAGSPSS